MISKVISKESLKLFAIAKHLCACNLAMILILLKILLLLFILLCNTSSFTLIGSKLHSVLDFSFLYKQIQYLHVMYNSDVIMHEWLFILTEHSLMQNTPLSIASRIWGMVLILNLQNRWTSPKTWFSCQDSQQQH